MVARLMLNLQNPALFSPSLRTETISTRSRSQGTDTTATQLGPFVTTIVYTGETTMGSIFTGTELSMGSATRSEVASGSGEEWWEDDYDLTDDLGYENVGRRRRRALWYDRAWVRGTRDGRTSTERGATDRTEDGDIGGHSLCSSYFHFGSTALLKRCAELNAQSCITSRPGE